MFYEQPPAMGSAIGIDWQAAIAGLAKGNPGFAFDGTAAHRLGSVHDLLPSKAWYTPWMVGQVVTAQEAEEDRAWWETLKAEANELGLKVSVEPTMGEDIWVEIDLIVSLPVVVSGRPALVRSASPLASSTASSVESQPPRRADGRISDSEILRGSNPPSANSWRAACGPAASSSPETGLRCESTAL